jgi:Peptidase inhibitor family I36
MKLNRRVAKTLTPLVALGLGGLFFAAPNASAAAVCGSNQVCLYQNSNETGSAFIINGSGHNVSDFSQETFTNGSPLNDEVSSMVNNTGEAVLAFSDANFSGLSIGISPHSQIDNLTSTQLVGEFINFNDVMSSIST